MVCTRSVVVSVFPSDEAEGPSDADELESPSAVREEELSLYHRRRVITSSQKKSYRFTTEEELSVSIQSLCLDLN